MWRCCAPYAVIKIFDRTNRRFAGTNDRRLLGLDMLTMSTIIKNRGLSAVGYEFINSSQLIDFLSKDTGSSAILLTKSNYTLRGFSIASILYFPFLPVMKIFDPILENINRHWILLDAINEQGIMILDPFFGRIFISKNRFEKLWSRYGLIVNKI